MRDLKKQEKYYRRRLHYYLEEHYGEYEDEIEYFNDPAINQWLFLVPQLNVRVKLTCDDFGKVTEQRYTVSMATERAYEILEKECSGMDAIYEDYIVDLIGMTGMRLLRRARLLESCGVIHGRNLYVLCKKQ